MKLILKDRDGNLITDQEIGNCDWCHHTEVGKIVNQSIDSICREKGVKVISPRQKNFKNSDTITCTVEYLRNIK